MDALILSCSTGGGHNAAGAAIREELIARGHKADLLDPYSLISNKLAKGVGNTYVRFVQRVPKLFGAVYAAGNLVRHMNAKSPVYYANIKTAEKLDAYLNQHHYDVIITPHLFPAEMITYFKRHEKKLPPTVFVATDYTCIPFTEETECDYYIVPGEAQAAEFEARGISRDRQVPLGIPVAGAFYKGITKKEARAILGLDMDQKYILLTGGSMGAGPLGRTTAILSRYIRQHKNVGKIIVICGSNERLYHRLQMTYGDEIILLRQTDQMALYMKACDLFVSKPGGLSSTEAAVTQIPFIQITSIPGCESHNAQFFEESGMSISVKRLCLELKPALDKLCEDGIIEKMQMSQEKGIPEQALFHICDWLEEVV